MHTSTRLVALLGFILLFLFHIFVCLDLLLLSIHFIRPFSSLNFSLSYLFCPLFFYIEVNCVVDENVDYASLFTKKRENVGEKKEWKETRFCCLV